MEDYFRTSRSWSLCGRQCPDAGYAADPRPGTTTEIFEFAARLAQHGVLKGVVNVEVSVFGIRDFVPTVESSREWSAYRAASEDQLTKMWSMDSDDLVAASAGYSMAAAAWFYDRFGWLQPSTGALKKDQDKFLDSRW